MEPTFKIDLDYEGIYALTLHKERYTRILGTEDLCVISLNWRILEHLEFLTDEHTVYFNTHKNGRGFFTLQPSEKTDPDVTHGWLGQMYAMGGIKLVQTSRGHSEYVVARADMAKLKEAVGRIPTVTEDYDPKCFDTVLWTEDSVIFREDIIFFVNKYQWFRARELPYRRSYLLHGAPGNGKSISIRALAKYLRTSAEVFDFTAHYASPDGAFRGWMLGEDSEGPGETPKAMRKASVTHIGGDIPQDEPQKNAPSLRLLVLEDLDRFYPMTGKTQTEVSLSCVLNCLDGATIRDNTVVVATANHPENLDAQVMLRPGRFDRRVCYEPPKSEKTVEYLMGLFKRGADLVTKKCVRSALPHLEGHSFAFLYGVFMASAVESYHRGSEVIEDADFLAAVDKENGDKALGTQVRGERKRPGFTSKR